MNKHSSGTSTDFMHLSSPCVGTTDFGQKSDKCWPKPTSFWSKNNLFGSNKGYGWFRKKELALGILSDVKKMRMCPPSHLLEEEREGRAMILVASALVEPQHGVGCGEGKLSPLDLKHGPKLGKGGVRAELKTACAPVQPIAKRLDQ